MLPTAKPERLDTNVCHHGPGLQNTGRERERRTPHIVKLMSSPPCTHNRLFSSSHRILRDEEDVEFVDETSTAT